VQPGNGALLYVGERAMPKRRVRLEKLSSRVRLEWYPEWDGVIKAYTIKFLRENLWRYDPVLCGMDDLLQDAYIVFERCTVKYPRVMHAPHFMALYKTALLNELIDLANKNIERKSAFVDGVEDVSELACNLADEGSVSIVLANAPPEVLLLLSVFASDRHLQELRKPSRRHRGLPRPSFNTRIKRILGLDSDADLVAAFREWLTA